MCVSVMAIRSDVKPESSLQMDMLLVFVTVLMELPCKA